MATKLNKGDTYTDSRGNSYVYTGSGLSKISGGTTVTVGGKTYGGSSGKSSGTTTTKSSTSAATPTTTQKQSKVGQVVSYSEGKPVTIVEDDGKGMWKLSNGGTMGYKTDEEEKEEAALIEQANMAKAITAGAAMKEDKANAEKSARDNYISKSFGGGDFVIGQDKNGKDLTTGNVDFMGFSKNEQAIRKYMKGLGFTDDEINAEINGYVTDEYGFNDYNDYLNAVQGKNTYNSTVKNAKTLRDNTVSANQDAYNNAIDEVAAQEDQAKREAEDKARQAYIAKMLADRDLIQTLNAQGLTGGATESAKLALLSGYEDTRRGINSNLSAALNNYGQQRSQLARELAGRNRDAEAAFEESKTAASEAFQNQRAQNALNAMNQGGQAAFANPKAPTMAELESIAELQPRSLYDIANAFNLDIEAARQYWEAYQGYKETVDTQSYEDYNALYRAHVREGAKIEDITTWLNNLKANGEINDVIYNKLLNDAYTDYMGE